MTATREEYLSIVAAEETELFIISLVDRIVAKSQDVLFERHIESQVLPYAVQFAKAALDELVEWEFFKGDDGGIEEETWRPDDEPEPAIIDSWAPGAIPVRKSISATPTTTQDTSSAVRHTTTLAPHSPGGITSLSKQSSAASLVDKAVSPADPLRWGEIANEQIPTARRRTMGSTAGSGLGATSATFRSSNASVISAGGREKRHAVGFWFAHQSQRGCIADVGVVIGRRF
ncbi:uncharacterized protein EV422DRAFT_371313 [Fimicolochytrium jonesii]|uniref:uncharacterized protein n=1 Tax=Fimicolochytrium jonesii TaxID=1396493 RepID=UPI0022FDFCA2|nr:uncharacterized protein EV422DRAFT_371313 [Fimicolochytrium jonesii]KAI8815591.1 hypothetical protein EV422DRAFT_371313 [Fimicolochytrium jonesii]